MGAPIPDLEVWLGLRLAAAGTHAIRRIADHRIQHLQASPSCTTVMAKTLDQPCNIDKGEYVQYVWDVPLPCLPGTAAGAHLLL